MDTLEIIDCLRDFVHKLAEEYDLEVDPNLEEVLQGWIEHLEEVVKWVD